MHTFKPFDKAGGYGIQEWMDLLASKNKRLPTHNVYGGGGFAQHI